MTAKMPALERYRRMNVLIAFTQFVACGKHDAILLQRKSETSAQEKGMRDLTNGITRDVLHLGLRYCHGVGLSAPSFHCGLAGR